MSLPQRPIVLVCGGRDFADADLVARTLSSWAPRRIIHGGARGLDALAGHWAALHQVEVKTYPADWKALGRKAGPIRNQQMLDSEEIHFVLAFPGGRGTADMVRRSRSHGLIVYEIRCPRQKAKRSAASAIDITNSDIATYMHQDRRSGDMIPKPSLVPSSAKRLLLAIYACRDPRATSKFNNAASNQIIHDTLMFGLENESDHAPLRYLHARNIIKHCGLSEKKWKALWRQNIMEPAPR